MDVPSIYYDPTGELNPFYDDMNNISFINSQNKLVKKIIELLYVDKKILSDI